MLHSLSPLSLAALGSDCRHGLLELRGERYLKASEVG